MTSHVLEADADRAIRESKATALELAGDQLAAQTLDAYLDVFTNHYLNAKQQRPIDLDDEAHQRLRALR